MSPHAGGAVMDVGGPGLPGTVTMPWTISVPAHVRVAAARDQKRRESETPGQAVQLPDARKVSSGCPGRYLVGQRGQRGRKP